MQEVTPRSVGALIGLYERAVGIYASLVNINAYHQPGKYCCIMKVISVVVLAWPCSLSDLTIHACIFDEGSVSN